MFKNCRPSGFSANGLSCGREYNAIDILCQQLFSYLIQLKKLIQFILDIHFRYFYAFPVEKQRNKCLPEKSMKRNFILALVICLFCWSCGGGGGGTSSGSGSGAPSDTGPIPTAISDTPYAVSVAATQDTAHYKAEDIVGNNTFDYTINIDFTNQTAQLSGGSVLDYSSGSVTPVTGVTVGNSTYGVTVTSTIAAKVRYNLTGGLNGTLTVNSSGEYQLYLNGVEIRAEDGPALDLESSQKVFIVSASGTANTLADSDNRILTMKASVYGKGTMIFSSAGTISVTGSYKHGIFSNDYIRMNGGTLNVNVSAKDAIRPVNAFIFDDGNLTINATGTTTDDESKASRLKVKKVLRVLEKGILLSTVDI